MYDIGDSLRLQASFYNAAATPALTDPTGVTVRIRTGAGTTTAYTYGVGTDVVKSAVGVYYIDITVTCSGTWRHRWAGTGVLIQAEEGAFDVRRQRV